MTATAENTILEMRNISKAFAGVQALKEVSFRCVRGTVHALVGENGAGKSTLMKILAGAYAPDSGEIIFKGRHFQHLRTREAIDAGIAIVYQELNLLPNLTVAENIFLGREPSNRWGVIDTRRMNRDADNLLNRLGVSMDARSYVGELTLARRQMVEIAKALSQQVEIIVMDEPSAILAGHELETLFAIIDSLIKQNVTVVYISHRLDEIFQIAHEVTVLKDGRVVGTKSIEDVTRPQLVQMMVGRPLDEVFPKGESRQVVPVLTAQNLTTEAIKGINLTLYAGEILGIAGMVGSGRTELARALFGADIVQAGTITMNGRQVHFASPAQAMRSGLALVPEDRKTQGLLMEQSIRNNLTLTILNRLTRGPFLQRRLENNAAAEARERLSINSVSPHQEVQYLSGGNQQKVVLAKWLARSPSVIILDEPTRGIDVGTKLEIYRLMRELVDKSVAILLISSELPEILGMSDRILVMRDGTIVGEFASGEATEEQIIGLATTGQQLIEATDV